MMRLLSMHSLIEDALLMVNPEQRYARLVEIAQDMQHSKLIRAQAYYQLAFAQKAIHLPSGVKLSPLTSALFAMELLIGNTKEEKELQALLESLIKNLERGEKIAELAPLVVDTGAGVGGNENAVLLEEISVVANSSQLAAGVISVEEVQSSKTKRSFAQINGTAAFIEPLQSGSAAGAQQAMMLASRGLFPSKEGASKRIHTCTITRAERITLATKMQSFTKDVQWQAMDDGSIHTQPQSIKQLENLKQSLAELPQDWIEIKQCTVLTALALEILPALLNVKADFDDKWALYSGLTKKLNKIDCAGRPSGELFWHVELDSAVETNESQLATQRGYQVVGQIMSQESAKRLLQAIEFDGQIFDQIVYAELTWHGIEALRENKKPTLLTPAAGPAESDVLILKAPALSFARVLQPLIMQEQKANEKMKITCVYFMLDQVFPTKWTMSDTEIYTTKLLTAQERKTLDEGYGAENFIEAKRNFFLKPTALDKLYKIAQEAICEELTVICQEAEIVIHWQIVGDFIQSTASVAEEDIRNLKRHFAEPEGFALIAGKRLQVTADGMKVLADIAFQIDCANQEDFSSDFRSPSFMNP